MADPKDTFVGVFDAFLEPSSFFAGAKYTLVFTIKTDAAFDPATGQSTGGTTDIYSAEGFFRPPKEKEFVDVQAQDTVFSCKQDELNYMPSINDKCTSDGKTYTVVEVKFDRAGGEGNTGVAYLIQLRSAPG